MRESALVFAAFAALGAVQSAPGVTTGDAGELTAAAATLGVAHAPGYPTYALAARAFAALAPIGSWAHRTNLFSALCGALALALLVDALGRFGAGRAARLGAAAVLGLSPVWRELSAVTEAFALLLAFAALLLWIAAAAGERLLDDGPAAALGLAFGLGVGAHQTLALVLPALLLIPSDRRRLPRALACAAAGALAGAAVDLYAPLRARRSPPLDWDHAVDLPSFWRLLTRRDYGSLSLTTDGAAGGGPEVLAAQAWRSARALAGQLGAIGTALALLGAGAWPRARLRLRAAAPWAWVLVSGPFFLMLGRPGFDAQTSGALERFHLLPLFGAAAFVAAGIEVLARERAALGAAAAVAAAAALVPAAAAQSRRGDYLAHDYGRALLRELPPGAAFVMDGGDDTFYSFADLSFAEGLRPDLEPHDRGGVVFRSVYGDGFRALTHDAKEARRRAVEAALADSGRLWYSTLNPGLLPGRTAVPAGLLRRPLKPGEPFPQAAALDATLPTPRAPDASRRFRDRALAGFVVYSRAASALARGDRTAGATGMELAAETAGDAPWAGPAIAYSLSTAGYEAMGRRDWAGARAAYAAQARVQPASAEPLTNLGVACERAGDLASAEDAMRAAAAREPRSARAWEELGALLWARGRWSDCAAAYDSAAALAPGGPDARWAAKARARIRP